MKKEKKKKGKIGNFAIEPGTNGTLAKVLQKRKKIIIITESSARPKLQRMLEFSFAHDPQRMAEVWVAKETRSRPSATPRHVQRRKK